MFDTSTAKRLKALSHPERLQILRLLGEPARFPDNLVDPVEVGVCVNDLARAAGLPQSTASRHMSMLTACGLIEVKPHGPWRYARRSPAAFHELAAAFQAVADAITPSPPKRKRTS